MHWLLLGFPLVLSMVKPNILSISRRRTAYLLRNLRIQAAGHFKQDGGILHGQLHCATQVAVSAQMRRYAQLFEERGDLYGVCPYRLARQCDVPAMPFAAYGLKNALHHNVLPGLLGKEIVHVALPQVLQKRRIL